ncbi:MAG: methylmalonyl-CoA epimerase [Candidatus Zixiibacteriota bacterium]
MSALISHVGIAVRDLDAAIEKYRALLGCEPVSVHDVPDQQVRAAFFDRANSRLDSGGRVELLQATSPDSPIARFIAKRGEGLHHICIYVDDLPETLARLKSSGRRLIDEVPRIGADGHRIAFVHPADTHGVLFELEER